MKKYLLILIFVIITAAAYTQDFGFGFGDDAEEAPSGGALPLSVKVGGEIGAEFIGFVHDFSSAEKAKASSLGDMLSGSLNFSAAGANVDAFIGLNLSAASFTELASGLQPAATPLLLDEAFVRAYFGAVNVEAGYRKLSWGKADSFGPLDVTNPVDYTDLTNISDIQAIKIARPMVHAAWNTGGFSKLEAVFMPNFTGHRFAQSGRWAPSQVSAMRGRITEEVAGKIAERYPLPDIDIQALLSDPVISAYLAANYPEILLLLSAPGASALISSYLQGMYPQMLASAFSGFALEYPNTSGLEYFQAGLRFTTTIQSADFGLQYFYGSLFQPDVSTGSVDAFIDDLIDGNTSLNTANLYTGNPDLLYKIKYNRYHQFGVDYAQVLFGFNVRSEFAIFLTEDLKGDDGSVRNPFLGWSLGFDRDLFWGINANVQCNETIRLMDDKVGKDPLLDCEAGTNVTSTRLTMQLSKKFLKDALETKTIIIWDIENSDCYIIPAIIWNIKDLTAELSAGVFAGKESGDLGQYWRNSFVKAGLKYSF